MTILAIGALTATVHEPDGRATHVRDVDRLLRRVADYGLPRRMDELGLAAGEWCLHRVDTTFVYEPDRHQAAAEDDWSDALTTALVDALRSTSRARSADAVLAAAEASPKPVVYYRHRDDAVVDLFTSVAGGSFERAWAWRQLGLVHNDGPWADPRAIVLRGLDCHPHVALRALRAAISDRGTAAVHRLLGESGWCALARIITVAAGTTDHVADALLHTCAPLPGRHHGTDGRAGRSAGQPSVQARSILALPLVQALLGAGLRAGPAIVRAWALVALAEADPDGLRRSNAAERVEWLASALADQDAAGLRIARPADPRAAPTSRVAGDAISTPSDPAPSDPLGGETERGAETASGGLLFLHNTAQAAGVPLLPDRDARLARRSLRWVLHQLAQRLAPVAADDPAALAFAGLPPDDPSVAGEPVTADEKAALDRAAAVWRERTWAAVADTRSPEWSRSVEDTVSTVVRRRGRILAEPGWVDVVLDLAEVDVDVRAAGLDLDPGWVPWLGTVMRFRYE